VAVRSRVWANGLEAARVCEGRRGGLAHPFYRPGRPADLGSLAGAARCEVESSSSSCLAQGQG
jgi:hypothetical protein